MKWSAYLFCLFLSWKTHAQIINEICSKNDYIIADKNGDYWDWIEIYNADSTAVNLNQFYLSDDATKLDKWIFPNFILAPGEFVLVFASNKEQATSELHCNFKISANGESIYLSDLQKEIIQQVNCPKLKANHSFGLDSLAFNYYDIPTPLQSNLLQKSYLGYTPEPVFSVQKPNIQKGTAVQITCESSFQTPQTAQIYYSLDGSHPYPNGKLYKEALIIDSTLSVKAVCHLPNYMPATTITQTYLINEGLRLPVIHINVEPDLFFNDTTGIHATGLSAEADYPFYGANFWWDKEIPINFVYYNPSNEQYFTENAVVEIHGGKSSRTRPMRSLRIEADNRVGASKFEFPFFDSQDLNTFYRLVLRNASSDFNQAHCRDALAAKHIAKSGLHLDFLSNQAVNTYINGQYWGLFHLRERIDKYYLKTKHNLEDDFNLLEKDTAVIEGNRLGFDRLYQKILDTDCSDNAAYNEVLQHFDLKNLHDYFITEIFFNNTDWPRNNVKYWQHPIDLKWRYLIFDIDAGMGFADWNDANFDLMGNILKETYDETHANILRCFLENDSFRQQFINRFADLLNTSFATEETLQSLQEMIETLEPELDAQFTKWAGDWQIWQTNINQIETYFEDKPEKQKTYINTQFNLNGTYDLTVDLAYNTEANVTINSLEEVSLPFKGQYFSGNPIQIKVQPVDKLQKFQYWHESIQDIYYYDEQLELDSQRPVYLTAFYFEENPPENYVFSNLIEDYVVVNYSDEVWQIRVINSSGQTVFSNRYNVGVMDNKLNRAVIDATKFTKGVYFLLLQNRKGLSSFKFVKL